MTGTTSQYQPRTVPPSSLWRSYTGTDAKPTAHLLTAAAHMIKNHGHNAYGEDDPGPGVSINQALTTVVGQFIRLTYPSLSASQRAADIEDLVDELESRVGSVLLLLGAHMPLNGLACLPFAWERDPASWYPRASYHGTDDVVRVLKLAAGMVELVDTSWPGGT